MIPMIPMIPMSPMSPELLESRMVCAGCGAACAPDAALPFACPEDREGDGIDHLLTCELGGDDASLAAIFSEIEAGEEAGQESGADGHLNPFLRFRALLHSYRLARRRGMTDADYCARVRGLDRAVAAVDGVGFHETPYAEHPALGLWIKDERGNVGGSHKARHLMGLAIHLDLIERVGLADLRGRELAIASCGNAALAAAIVARAIGRPLRVFIPPPGSATVPPAGEPARGAEAGPVAAPGIVERLRALGAISEICHRAPGDPPGDPCVRRYRQAVAGGALPFSCQGDDNGLTIQGGQTLGWELALQHRRRAAGPLGELLIQVGGGALASAVIQALGLAARAGIAPLPRIFAVQTARVHPLARAFAALAERAARDGLAAALAYARGHRGEFMVPWPEAPTSVAEGILDDETYDWAAVVGGLVASGGRVLLADEATLLAANARAEAAGISASITGTAGIAGALDLPVVASGSPSRAVLVTGARL